MAIVHYGPITVSIPDFSPKDIKSLRALTKLSQFDFAVKYNFNLYTLQSWESGKRRPSIQKRFALQKIKESIKSVSN